MKGLVIISVGPPGEPENNLLGLASWMGAPARAVPVRGDTDLIDRAFREGLRTIGGVALSANTLAALGRAGWAERFTSSLRGPRQTLLVFGIADTASHRQALQGLTQGAVSVTPIQASSGHAPFSLPEEAREFSRQLAGSTFTSAQPTRRAGLGLAASGDAQAIVVQGSTPVFAHVRVSSCSVFLLTDGPMPDVQAEVPGDHGMAALYEGLIPPLIFLRTSFGKACWHGVDRTARLIIDDPLLKRRYGFLDFERLTGTLRQTGSGITIAFIPWNYRRTSEHMTSTFASDPSDISICIHGCDHTSNEFGGSDAETLSQRAKLAVQRMTAHHSRTGIPFERIMVFPQGRFSTAAIGALRTNGYVAAVDSACVPIDGTTSRTVADLLRPAIQVQGFPVFKRHYPRQLVDFAFDLFLGKPALVVEHHAYFKDGGASFDRLVRDLNRIEPELKWPQLGSQLTHSCFVRSPSEDEAEVMFYTREFHLRNTRDRPVYYRLSKEEPNSQLVHRVLANGVGIPFCLRDGNLSFELEVDPGSTVRIEVVDQDYPLPAPFRGSRTYAFCVRLRRILSEFRDERLARYPALLSTAIRLVRALGVRVTG